MMNLICLVIFFKDFECFGREVSLGLNHCVLFSFATEDFRDDNSTHANGSVSSYSQSWRRPRFTFLSLETATSS